MKIHTFGCKVNQVESLKIEEQLFEYNVIVINTCTLTEKADAKCRNFISRTIRQNPNKKIIVTGCLVERDIDELRKKYPFANVIFVKNKDKLKISEIANLTKKSIIKNCKKNKTRAFLKIQDGCDSFCSYCIVPYVRTKKWSMPIEDIKNELDKIYNQGFNEIVLTGIRIGFYNWQGYTLGDVLDLVLSHPQSKRIRISSIEPTELTHDLINTIANNTYKNGRGICPHLHISFQSGSDKILKNMERKYDTEHLRKLTKNLRSKIKNLRITIDLIIGYPTETNEDFENTLKLLKELNIDGIHCFTFSPRKGTKAYQIKEKVPEHIIKKRKTILKNFDLKQRIKSAEKLLGKKTEILIEKNGGYTPNYIKVNTHPNKKLINQFIKVVPKKMVKDWPVWLDI